MSDHPLAGLAVGDLIDFLDASPSPWHAGRVDDRSAARVRPRRRGRRLDRPAEGRLRSA